METCLLGGDVKEVKRYKLASPRETQETQDAELYKMLICAIAFKRNTGGRAHRDRKARDFSGTK